MAKNIPIIIISLLFGLPVLGQFQMASSTQDLMNWNRYPTYTQYTQFMDSIANEYSIASLVEIGNSAENRKIYAIKISDQVALNENEPKVFLNSSIHGDELAGYVLMLRLSWYLLSNYYTDFEIKKLVDQTEIFICPLANPDGAYFESDDDVTGAIRFNKNGVDLNRNYPYPAEAGVNSATMQPEVVQVIDFLKKENFTMGLNIHGGAEVVNYPWDFTSIRHPDDAWFQHISKQYADTAQFYSGPGYMTSPFTKGYTNGFDWYQVFGSEQDYANYYTNNREIILEISAKKLVDSDLLPYYWDFNHRSLLRFIETAQFGLRGVIKDTETGKPLSANIELLSHDTPNTNIKTQKESGFFIRNVLKGTYTLKISSKKYIDSTLQVTMPKNDTIFNLGEILLTPNPNSINELPETGISIYPSPANNIIQVQGVQFIQQLQLLDIQGKVLINRLNMPINNQLNISELKKGIYVIRIYDGQLYHSLKFIKN